MATITKRSNGKHRVRYSDGAGKRASKTFNDFKAAKRFCNEAELLELQIKSGEYTAPLTPKSMPDIFKYWMDHRAIRKRKPKDDLSIINKHIGPALDKYLIKDVSVEVVDRFIFELRQKQLSAKTISNILTLLGSLLRLSHDLEWIIKIPKIKKPSTKEFSKEFSYLKSQTEITKFLIAAKAEGQMIHTLYLTSLMTGMRLGEVAGLKWDRIDFQRNQIMVSNSFDGPTKNKTTRYVILFPENKVELLKWRLQNPCELVFPNKNNNMLSGSARVFQEKFKQVQINAGFPVTKVNGRNRYYIRYHDLRHTFASHWVMRGADQTTLQHLMGHKDNAMLQRYAHLNPENYVKYHNLFDGMALPHDSNVISLRR